MYPGLGIGETATLYTCEQLTDMHSDWPHGAVGDYQFATNMADLADASNHGRCSASKYFTQFTAGDICTPLIEAVGTLFDCHAFAPGQIDDRASRDAGQDRAA